MKMEKIVNSNIMDSAIKCMKYLTYNDIHIVISKGSKKRQISEYQINFVLELTILLGINSFEITTV